ncbi:dihydropteroate synthase [Providencia hangzhouensis]
MVTVFGILNLTEDSFFDESRRLDPAGAVTAAIEMLRVGSDVVDVGPAASHPDARPVSPADEIRRIAPALRRPVRSDAPCFNRQLPTGNPALCATSAAWAT